MSTALVRPRILYAWKGSSLLIVDPNGRCGGDESLSGYYYREARFLRTLRFEIDGHEPWLCECAMTAPDTLAFTYVYPELTTFGGGGSGQSGDEESTDEAGILHRALAIRSAYAVRPASLEITIELVNHSRGRIECELACEQDADFADIQEAHGGERQQNAAVSRGSLSGGFAFTYEHPRLPYRSEVRAGGSGTWDAAGTRLRTRVALDPQQASRASLHLQPVDADGAPDGTALIERDRCVESWRSRITRVLVPQNALALRLVQQPPPESLTASAPDRFGALLDTLWH